MASPRMTFPEDEFWDCVDELPHLTDRVLFLHRQNGLSIEQIAKRLGIEQKGVTTRK
jgi:DNA-directed RNA polymerase specialized sigma24 family protein